MWQKPCRYEDCRVIIVVDPPDFRCAGTVGLGFKMRGIPPRTNVLPRRGDAKGNMLARHSLGLPHTRHASRNPSTRSGTTTRFNA